MTGSDDHSRGKGPSPGPVLRSPDNEDEVHSSAELDFDQLTTSTMDFPAIEIEQVSVPTEPVDTPPPAEPTAEVKEDVEIEISSTLEEAASVMEEAPSIFEKANEVATPMDRVTFSNLEALVPPAKAKPAAVEPTPAAKPVQRQTTIHEVRPPSSLGSL